MDVRDRSIDWYFIVSKGHFDSLIDLNVLVKKSMESLLFELNRSLTESIKIGVYNGPKKTPC